MQNELLSNLSHLGYEFSNIKMSNHVRGQESYSHELQLRQRCTDMPLITFKIFSAELI